MNSEFIKRILSSIILLPLTFFIVIEGSFLFVIFLVICFFISIYEWNNMSKNKKYRIAGLFFLLISFLSIYNLRLNSNENYLLFTYIIIICISTDIGGYVFGNIFKGPKLTNYSPNKTISGLLGSIMFSQSSFLILYLFLDYNYLDLKLIIVQFFLCIISVFGDIFFSYIKRINNIKDYSNLIPGHGGILDRIDGMIFVVIFYNLASLKNVIQ